MKFFIHMVAKVFLAILIIISIAIIAFVASNYIYLGTPQEGTTAYLRKNSFDISKKDFDERLLKGFFDSDFYDSNMFLLGESHGFADVQELDKLLFTHLNREIGLRYYLAEMDSIRANKLNEFLSGAQKDSSLLKQVVLDIKQAIPQQSSKELFAKWSYFYDYNQNLEDSLKIMVIGIDRNYEAKPTSISRDSIMFLNFRDVVISRGLEKEKFYGLFGHGHVLQNGINKDNFNSFASLVRSSNLSHGKEIKSIVCYTLDSEAYFPKNNDYPGPEDEKTGLLNADGPIVLVEGINDLRAVTKENTITIFNLEKENTPYHENQNLAKLKVNFLGGDLFPSDETKMTTAYFQYAVLIRNSAALTKIE